MATTAEEARAGVPASRVIRLPGIVLGVGLGGFLDGILLHQLLQWHHMLSSTNHDRIGVRYYNPHTVSGLRMNTVWDGVFHAVCWIAVLLGLAILYARVTHDRRRVWGSRVLWGWMLVGWGLFNLVEGVLDHQILGIHHVHGGPSSRGGTPASSSWAPSWWSAAICCGAAGPLRPRGAPRHRTRVMGGGAAHPGHGHGGGGGPWTYGCRPSPRWGRPSPCWGVPSATRWRSAVPVAVTPPRVGRSRGR
ncbi:hypothetical protein SVIO_091330 [Streptomyces violaceusniger]|uniref:DUF2243 domain-containing protein n=1 Tax=Streptomyces violaceusniger TaxID=68280 RepID=A0A4D4LH87_STRVO|nr:hypothetical protein SVIO_091330 [Streptomyces violaceusniger]